MTDKSQQREFEAEWDRHNTAIEPHEMIRYGMVKAIAFRYWQAALSQPAAAPGHTDLMVTPESIDAFMQANPLPTDQPAVAGAVDEKMIEEWETARFGAVADDGSFVEFKNNGDSDKHPLGMQAQWFGGRHDHKVAVAVLRALRTASPSQPAAE